MSNVIRDILEAFFSGDYEVPTEDVHEYAVKELVAKRLKSAGDLTMSLLAGVQSLEEELESRDETINRMGTRISQLEEMRSQAPITAEWLDTISVRQKSGIHDCWVVATCDLVGVVVVERDGFQVCIRGNCMLVATTIGQLKKLCDALECPINEPEVKEGKV